MQDTTYGSVTHYLDALQIELDLARERYTQANGDEKFRPTLAAAQLAKLQRLSSHALKAAVTEAHEAGVTWRELAPHVQIHVATLHRQWQREGAGLVVGHLSPSE